MELRFKERSAAFQPLLSPGQNAIRSGQHTEACLNSAQILKMPPTRVYVAIPAKPTMNPRLLQRASGLALAMVPANPRLELVISFDCRPVTSESNDVRPWSKVARARNRVINDIDLEDFEYILWIDADVVDYQSNLPTRLLKKSNEGIIAPMIFIENTKQFYDWAAFVIHGKDYIEPENRQRIVGRNLQHAAPYWPQAPDKRVVEMDCVGTVLMVPSWVYKSGVRYADHPAFTDHYPICKQCRDMGAGVFVDTETVAYHADLPRWGEKWH